jgi:putative transposase
VVREHGATVGVEQLCKAIGLSKATYYRTETPKTPSRPRHHHRRLGEQLEHEVLTVLNSEQFCDMAPAEIFATLLDDGVYLCSESTMYRVLKRSGGTRQRRQHEPQKYKRPELLATRINEVWTWDITKLRGPIKWTYFYLYTILDIYSRYVVGWLLAPRESAELAKDLIAETCLKQEIVPGTLLLHADGGSAMKAKTVGELLMDLGVTKSHSRPHVSDDNPFIESSFKTLKYRPDFPDRFGSFEQGVMHCQRFYDWYNNHHRHSGIGMLTPADVHWGSCDKVLANRQNVLNRIFLEHPERFVKGVTMVKQLPKEVWINKPIQKTKIDCKGLA